MVAKLAQAFAKILPSIFKKCSSLGIPLKIYQHCLPSQNNDLRLFYEKNNIDFETFNFSNNLIHYFSKVNIAITRSGSSFSRATNSNIPFVCIRIPSSADNHQLKMQCIYQKKFWIFSDGKKI